MLNNVANKLASELANNVVDKIGRIFFILFSNVIEREANTKMHLIIPFYSSLSYASVVFDLVLILY